MTAEDEEHVQPTLPANGDTATNSTVSGAAGGGGSEPLLCVVDFHHARGPEVERWFGAAEGSDPAVDNDWSLLPFMALSDGAHTSTEDFSYFTLLRPATDHLPATSLFGISCTRQMDASQLLVRPADVTRSTVQKAVVVIADSPQFFGMLRERLSVVTQAWFAQKEFSDVEILRRFQESLAEEKERGVLAQEEDRDQYLGMSLRELVREFRWQTLVLLKCCLLQPKMLFFGSRCERLCMMQFSLISLIPGLLRNLEDCAGPELNSYETKMSKPTNLRTSDRSSLLAYMGLPLQIFGKGSLFGPYTPLQQLDILADSGTRSYIVGSTNSLLLQQRDRYSDIIINLDENTINITSTSLKTALQLSAADRRWIDFITQEVNDTWDEANPGRPNTMGYVGSEEFIRLQFEEYLLSLVACARYHLHLAQHGSNPRMLLPHIEGDPSHDFGTEFVEYWARTENYRLWAANTEDHLFDIVEPKHPCAGGLTIDDVQRRLAQQVQDLHLDERFAHGREAFGRNWAAGRDKASTMFNKLYADMEALRQAQRERADRAKQQDKENEKPGADRDSSGSNGLASPVDLGKAQQTMQSVGAKANAYMSSWTAWAGEKRKTGWGRSSSNTAASSSTSSSGGGWGLGVGRNKNKTKPMATSISSISSSAATSTVAPSEKGDLHMSRMSTASAPSNRNSEADNYRPVTQGSLSESIRDDVLSEEGSLDRGPTSPRRTRPLSSSGKDGKRAVLDAEGKSEEGAATEEGEEAEEEATAEVNAIPSSGGENGHIKNTASTAA